jgi:hypothetical protein
MCCVFAKVVRSGNINKDFFLSCVVVKLQLWLDITKKSNNKELCVCVCFVLCGCFGNMCTCIYCVFVLFILFMLLFNF